MTKLYAFDSGRGKKVLIGQVIGNALLIRKNADQRMKKFDAYGIDERAFGDAKKNGIVEIRIHRLDTEQRLKASTEIWETKSKTMDFGHGKQLFLSIKYMEQYEPQLDYPTELERSR